VKFRFGFGISPDLKIQWKIVVADRKRRRRIAFTLLHVCMYALLLCTLPTAPVSRSFGLRYYYESIYLTLKISDLTTQWL
jgi:hypothetical protein